MAGGKLSVCLDNDCLFHQKYMAGPQLKKHECYDAIATQEIHVSGRSVATKTLANMMSNQL